MRSDSIISYLNTSLPGVLGKEGHFSELIPVGGGSINEAYAFVYSGIKYFLKVNKAKRFPGMFAIEARGLELFAKGKLTVPQVVFTGVSGQEQLLVLEYLERKGESPEFFHDLGKELAAIHRNSNDQFGLEHANYIGSLPQDNSFKSTWNEFFVCNRIEPLLKDAIDSGKLPITVKNNFNSLFGKLDDLFPKERPALLHGDLWSGNKMNTVKGPAIFDPAVYYGHREVDIAMSTLFGGFDQEFYRSYNAEFPLEKGWEGRVELFNLYPLLVHVILFGGGYAGDVTRIIRKF